MQVNLTPEAQDDLFAIQDFIAEGHPHAAVDLVDALFDAFDRLASHPFMGHKREDLTSRDVRFWNVRSYLIIYNSNTTPLTIVRVLSGYRDIASILSAHEDEPH